MNTASGVLARGGERSTAAAATVAGVGVAVALGAAVLAARHAAPSMVSPVSPPGGWRTVWTAGAVAALALYGIGSLLARTARLRLSAAVALAVAVQALPLAAPLLLSKDAFLYWGEGRVITTYRASPYTTTPADHPRDVATPLISQNWAGEPAPYGPAWEAVGTLPALAAGDSPHRAQLGYRILALLGVLAAVAVVATATRSAAAVAFLGWNPVVALHYAGGGHSDAWMVALLLVAVGFRPRAWAGAAWPVAAAFKAFPLVLLPLELARTRLRLPRGFWIGLAGSAVVVAGASSAAFGTDWISGSLVSAHQSSPLGGVHWLTEAGLRHRYAVALGALVFVAVYAWLLREAWRSGRARFSLAATALCLTSSLLRPWYALWPVALAAVELDAAAAAAAYALSAYVLLWDAVPL